MLTKSDYLDIIDLGINALKSLNREPKGLYAPVKYALGEGGKRLRPMLVLAVVDALGENPKTFLNQALALEMFHNFTLLHDDVMDGAEVRRGHPTVHCRWDTNTAILSGDAMLTLASMLLIDGLETSKIKPAIELFNQTAIEVYEGQQYDMDFENRRKVSVEDYLMMIRLKTSVLLGCATEMGAILAGALPEVRKAFRIYGEKLGLAFQLRDDLLDTFGDPTLFGKAIGGDIVNDKKTWLLITALEEEPALAERLGNAVDNSKKIEFFQDAYRRLGLPQRCQELIKKYVDEAIDALKTIQLPLQPFEFFSDLALKTIVRDN